MRVAVFIALLLGALCYAALRGGGPERVMAAIAASMVALDQALHAFVPPAFATLDAGHLGIDLYGAAATLVLALAAYRFWPMPMAVLHVLPLLAHTSRMLDAGMHPAAYLTMQVASSWLVPPLLVIATMRHRQRQRLARNGSEPSWAVTKRVAALP